MKKRSILGLWRFSYQVANNWRDPWYGGWQLIVITPLFGFGAHRCFPEFTRRCISTGFWIGTRPHGRRWIGEYLFASNIVRTWRTWPMEI
jgi:hypothetical protein